MSPTHGYVSSDRTYTLEQFATAVGMEGADKRTIVGILNRIGCPYLVAGRKLTLVNGRVFNAKVEQSLTKGVQSCGGVNLLKSIPET